ncbi:MAG TPA: hypothetical protein VH255_04215 [Verrucomicrobiae bacterium]|nr:hypothetical protein [Verrucomicrobiae bacterium]
MKKPFLLFLLATFALNVFGDSASIIMQKARDLSTSPQNGPGSAHSQPAQSATTPAVPAVAPLPPEQQAVANELALVKTNDTHQLAAELLALAHGAQKPSSATIDKLAEDLAAAFAGHTIPLAQRARMAQDIQTVFSAAASLPPSRTEAFIVDVPLVLNANNVASVYTGPVGNDLRAARKEVTTPAPTPIATP